MLLYPNAVYFKVTLHLNLIFIEFSENLFMHLNSIWGLDVLLNVIVKSMFGVPHTTCGDNLVMHYHNPYSIQKKMDRKF